MKILLTVNYIGQTKVPEAGYSVHHIGGKSGNFQWEHSEEQAINYIEGGLFDYFIKEDGQNMKLKVSTAPDGNKCLKVGVREEIPITQLHLPVRE